MASSLVLVQMSLAQSMLWPTLLTRALLPVTRDHSLMGCALVFTPLGKKHRCTSRTLRTFLVRLQEHSYH
eukprot:5042042-Amphidinium_carterae.1